MDKKTIAVITDIQHKSSDDSYVCNFEVGMIIGQKNLVTGKMSLQINSEEMETVFGTNSFHQIMTRGIVEFEIKLREPKGIDPKTLGRSS